MIKLLIGGSPCTHWSIAQTNNRETKAEGIGWELFRNYLIAKEKFKPDFFLYENNKSASQAIKDQIAYELKVGIDPEARFTYINSALVSAQYRQRFYVTNFGNIEQPEDRGILLRDVLENGLPRYEKSQCLDANYFKGGNYTHLNKQSGRRLCVAEPVGETNGKSFCLTANYKGAYMPHTIKRSVRTTVAEPIRVGNLPNQNGELNNSQSSRIYDIDGKSVTLCASGGGLGAKTGLYAIPVDFSGNVPTRAKSMTDGKIYDVYKVVNNRIFIKDNWYDIKLSDGYYIIRKLTVVECCRLQTLPDDYCKIATDTKAYQGLGNGWTAEVIIHLLNHALKDVSRDERIIVLSLYDGIGTGRYCLDKMGFKNVDYYAYEIDSNAMEIANDNYPDIIQCGDAFAVRDSCWKAPSESLSLWLDSILKGG